MFILCPEPSPAKSVCAAERLQSADRSDLRAVRLDAPVSCRQMAPLNMVTDATPLKMVTDQTIYRAKPCLTLMITGQTVYSRC